MRWPVVMCLALWVGVGCGGCEERSRAGDSLRSSSQSADRQGEENEGGRGSIEVQKSDDWPNDPQRVVSMAPNVTEILFELGYGDRVVAVTRYCDWPPEVDDLPSIGGMLDPDLEAMLAAEPDVVVGVQDGADHRIVDQLEAADIAYGFIAIDDLASIEEGILLFGEWLGADEQARRVTERFQRDLKSASNRVQKAVGDTQLSALLTYDREPIVAAGPGSFGDELLAQAGLDNAVPDDGGAYPVLDMEAVLSANPDVVVDVSTGASTREVQRFWERFDAVSAVREERIIHLDDPVMMRPGPRFPTALERLGEAVEAL